MPFILRGVALVGVDSVMAPLEIRNQAWQRLAKDLDLAMLETLTREIALAEAIPAAHELMDGKVRADPGRHGQRLTTARVRRPGAGPPQP